jgi:hypothetical protein
MTITEFLNLHIINTAGNINYGNRVNVLYNETGGNSEGEIIAITVTVNALSFNGNQDASATDITDILEQVEEITFTFDGITYILTVLDRSFYADNPAFYYFRVESNQLIPNIFDADITSNLAQSDVVVSFHPFLNDITFGTSEFNVLLNNGNNLRKSTDKLEADREEGFVVPSNFQSILTLSASKAQVQDSNYSDTGYINARYEGSVSEASDQGGVDPSLSAKEFTGIIFSEDTNQDVVCGLVGGAGQRVEVQLLHTGETRLPTFTTSSAGIEADGAIAVGDTAFNYTYLGAFSGQLVPSIDVGDFLIPVGSTEIMRVEEHNVFNKRLVVTRNYVSGSIPGLGTTTTLGDGTDFAKVQRQDIIKVEDFANNLAKVNNSKIFISENNAFVRTDSFGTIISSTACPDPLLVAIDDDNVNTGG